jgi:hypothetical protein
MAYQSFPGGFGAFVGPGETVTQSVPTAGSVTLDLTGEALILYGHILTSDGGSHTIDTTGSSAIGWRTGTCTFANAGTTVKVGIAPMDTGTGPVPRASNVADVITFDVSKSYTGGGGGIASNTSVSSVPDAGTKTIAHGDLVAICVQMTARAGADSVIVSSLTPNTGHHFPGSTSFLAATYAIATVLPNMFITFSDGATGWIAGSEIAGSTPQVRTWNSGSATKEYGQLYSFPFPCKVAGVYGWVDPDADFDIVLYSDPLGGSPVAEKTVSIDANTASIAAGRKFILPFASPLTVAANAPVAAIFKPGASNISAYYRTLAAAGHRVADAFGTSGYGVARASGAFAAENSNLDQYYIGLVLSAFSDGLGGGSQRVYTG